MSSVKPNGQICTTPVAFILSGRFCPLPSSHRETNIALLQSVHLHQLLEHYLNEIQTASLFVLLISITLSFIIYRCDPMNSNSPTLLTDEARRELKARFDLFDSPPTGSVLASNIGTIIRAFGENPTEAQIEQIVNKANQKDGTISFDELVVIIQDLQANTKKLTISDVEAAFRVFDPTNCGTISAEELKKVLTTFGEILSEEEADELISIVETTADGRINYVQLAAKLVS